MRPALAAGASDTHTTAAQTLTGATDTILVTADNVNKYYDPEAVF